MSIKMFCDGCEAETERNYVHQRYMPSLYANGERWGVEITVKKGSTWNDGHLCKECLFKILNSRDVEMKK